MKRDKHLERGVAFVEYVLALAIFTLVLLVAFRGLVRAFDAKKNEVRAQTPAIGPCGAVLTDTECQ